MMRCLLAIAAVIGLTACGSLVDDRQHAIDSGDLERAFDQKATTTTTTTPPFSTAAPTIPTTTTTIAPETLPIYLVVDETHIKPVPRRRTQSGPVTLKEVIALLMQPPTASEAGLSNKTMATPDALVVLTDTNDPPRIRVTPLVQNLAPVEQARFVAQLVFTIARVPGVSDVELFIQRDGLDTYWQPPRADGTFPEPDDPGSARPRRGDYTAFTTPA